MVRFLSQISLAAVILGVAIAGQLPWGGVFAQDTIPGSVLKKGDSPPFQHLVLTNGQTLSGRIDRVNDRYRVEVEGGTLWVREIEVEFLCRDLDEAYRLKRQRRIEGDIRASLDLCAWCLRNDLLDRAAQELTEAAALAPNHPMIQVLERRLDTALDPPRSIETVSRPLVDERLSAAQLDRLVARMPPGTMEVFTRSVQPLLANRCATAACHGPGCSSDFTIDRLPPSGKATRLGTQRNLQHTLAWIDRENPNASPLLTVPTQPHGNAAEPIFTQAHYAQYSKLVTWVRGIARAAAPVVPTSHDRPTSSSVTPVDRIPAMLPDATVTRSPGQVEQWIPPWGGDSVDLEMLNPGGLDDFGDPAGTIQRGASIPRFVPVDPFDPEIFNRAAKP